MLIIRKELPVDAGAVRMVQDAAFGRAIEGSIVEALRGSGADLLSLVADFDGVVTGHILFSPAVIEMPDGPVAGMGLAPMAVLPEFQSRGIGSKLVREGIRILESRSCPFVIVLGHEHFYQRFGFKPASQCGLSCQWEGVPDSAFMALILDGVRMAGVSGVARYRDEFDEAV